MLEETRDEEPKPIEKEAAQILQGNPSINQEEVPTPPSTLATINAELTLLTPQELKLVQQELESVEQ